MITANQLDPIIQSAVGRPSTPYEQTTYATASPQTLANLPSAYSSLRPDVSITDYLKHTGQDSSIQARTALGQKYDISNIGTAEGNIALLNALKSGKTPSTSPTPVTGSISGATPTPTTPQPTSLQKTAPSPSIGQAPQGGQTPDNTPQTPDTLPGSISSAAGTSTDQTQNTGNTQADPNQPPVNPQVATTLNAYQDAQSQVASIDSNIADLRGIMTQSLADKKAQVERNGGIVNSSQLAAEVAAENAPLQAQITNLLSQRSQYANAQSLAGKSYTDALAAQKESDANFYKSATLNQGQEKITNQQAQFTQKEQDVADKLQQTGYKLASTTDEFGNKVNYWTKNPGDTSGYNTNGQPVSISTNSQGVTTATPKEAPSNTDTSNPNGLSVAQYGLLANVKDFNPTTNPLDKDAYVYLTNYLSGSGTSTNSQGGKTLQLKSDIQNRAATLYEKATGQKLPTANTVSISNGLIEQNQGLLNQLDVQTGTIQQNFGLNLENLDANNLNSKAPIINNLLNSYASSVKGDPAVAQYLSQNQTIQNELASLLSVKNASGTTVADKLSSMTILPAGATPEQAKAIVNVLMKEAQNQSQTILNTNAKLYIKVDGLGLNPQNPVNNTIVMTDKSGKSYQFDPNSMTPQQLNDAFNSGYTLTSQQ